MKKYSIEWEGEVALYMKGSADVELTEGHIIGLGVCPVGEAMRD